jgi:hypothetical protein
MTSSPHTRSRRRAFLAFPAVLVVAAAIAPSTFAATPVAGSAQPGPYIAPAGAPTTSGIIMRDGGVCDPIRHMGC